jgi:hypothetical protein
METILRPIDLHGQTVKAKVVRVFPDLWGVTVAVMTDELGLIESNMHRHQAGDVKEGDDIEVKIYCSNLMMPALFEIVNQ